MERDDRPILSIIQKIKTGEIDPKGLLRDVRRQCVEALLFEGYSVAQIAQILSCSEKTVRRDIDILQDQNFAARNANLVNRLIGNLLIKMETHSSFLMRLARGREGSVGERVQAEYLAWKATEEATKLLQTMGILPLKPKEIIGDFSHHMTGSQAEKSFEELGKVLDEVLSVAEETDTVTPELKQNVSALRLKLEKSKIEYEANKLLIENNETQSKEDQNERNL